MPTTFKNKRGEWVPAIPEPWFYPILGMVCCGTMEDNRGCGKKFLRRKSYEKHYAYKHIVLGE